MSKILYAAGTMEHIRSFHLPYIEQLRRDGHEVMTMAKGNDADFNIGFVKKMLSPKNTSCRRKIRKILKAEKFDAIILNTTLAAFHIRLALPRRKRPKVINLVHGYMFFKGAKSTREKIFLACEKLLKGKTDHVIVMNSEDYQIATENKLCRGEVRVVRGMGAVVGKEQVPPETIYHYTDSKGKFVICFVGELYRAKNQRMLICALPEIKLEIPNAVLWFVGEGIDRHELIALADELNISDSVYFMGDRRNPCDYMRACDLYVSASEKEGLPFNVMEALGCGKTVLATDIKGHRDIIEDGVSGYLFPLGDMNSLLSLVKDFHSGKIGVDAEVAKERFELFSKEKVFCDTYGTVKELLSK
ncbi:MAG: glycosyltransferase [Clostridia bacterium]|nr:glycosyltransferase [Clostridia bacterium]